MNPDSSVSLARFGSFTVGGRTVEVSGQPTQVISLSSDVQGFVADPNGSYHVEHAYVQFFVPAEERGLPVVMVHGGGLTGACWETTPDGRAGWIQFFLRAGRAVYVVDGVERGRAGWCPLPGIWDESQRPVLRSQQESWHAFRIGAPEDFDRQKPHPGSLFPIQHFDNLARQQVPRWTTTNDLSIAAIAELIRDIGRCVVIGHSQGGGLAAHAALASSECVAATVLVEPHGLPSPQAFSAADLFPQMIVACDFIDTSPLYRGLRDVWLDFVDGLADRGGKVEYADLPSMGHPGNSHMPMMDSNSDVVADVIEQWLKSNAS